jgi:hypothetical protein
VPEVFEEILDLKAEQRRKERYLRRLSKKKGRKALEGPHPLGW